YGAPAARLSEAHRAIHRPPRDAGRRLAAGAQPVFVLELGQATMVVDSDRAAQAVSGCAWAAALGCDQDNALACSRPVDRTGRRTFEDLHVCDVIRVDVDSAIGRGRAA